MSERTVADENPDAFVHNVANALRSSLQRFEHLPEDIVVEIKVTTTK